LIASQHLMTLASQSALLSVCEDWSNKLNTPIKLGWTYLE